MDLDWCLYLVNVHVDITDKWCPFGGPYWDRYCLISSLVTWTISKFVDDTKMSGVVNTSEGKGCHSEGP